MEEKDKKPILIFVSFLVFIFVVIIAAIVISPTNLVEDSAITPVNIGNATIINLEQDFSGKHYNDGSKSYWYEIKGEVKGLDKSQVDNVKIEYEYYGKNDKILKEGTDTVSSGYGSNYPRFSFTWSSNNREVVSKVVIKLIGTGGKLVDNATFTVNMNKLEIEYEKLEVKEDTSTSSSSSSSSSRGSTRTISTTGDYYYSGTHMEVTAKGSALPTFIGAPGTYFLVAGDKVEIFNGDLTFVRA